MTWVYEQSTGNLSHNGRYVAKGYAGKGAGKNNAQMEGTPDTGPLPRGKYSIRGLRANGTKTYAKEITNCYN